MYRFKLSLVLLSLIVYRTDATNSTPIVLWHGIGENCCEPGSIGGFKNFLEMSIPGVYVLSIKIGQDLEEDQMNSYFMPGKEQLSKVCKMVGEDPNLKSGYHAVGFSQGGLLMRALAQTCPEPRIINLITFGGPHQGVYGYPQCEVGKIHCDVIRRLVSLFVYNSFVQIAYVPFQYWHDPLNVQRYAEGSTFLSDVNNVKEFKREYRDNLLKLNKFVMIRFLKDVIVIPYQSAWFGFYKDGQSQVVLSVNETQLYLNDSIGLKQLDTDLKLVFLDIDAPHMVFDYVWVKNNVLKYLT